MGKNNLVLKSVRIDHDVLERIAQMQKKHSYWSNNAIINGILYAACKCMDDDSLYDMARYRPTVHEDVTAEFKINKKSV